MTPSRTLTWASLAALILIWGTTWAAIRVGLRGVPPFTGVALRFALAALALLAVSPLFGARLPKSGTEWRLLAANALLTFSLPYGLLYWAEQWVPSGLASVLFATFPLFTAVFAHVLLEERLTAKAILGILTGFAGVAVIFAQDFQALGGSQVASAAALLLLSPLSAAVGGVAIKRWGAGVHPMTIAALPMGMTALLMGLLAITFESGRPLTFDTPSILALLYLGLCGSALPFTLYFWLLKHQTATGLSLINYVTPVIAVFVGTLFLDEPFTVHMAAGAVLVLLGVAVVLARWRMPRSSRS